MTNGNTIQKNKVLTQLQALASPEKAEHLSRFFKTGKGQYGEGDKFLGITVPQQRVIAKQNIDCPWDVMEENIDSHWHEVRLTTLLILIEKYKKEELRELCIEFYINHLNRINNLDLVDLSCYNLLGNWLHDSDRNILYEFAKSDN